MFRQSEQHQDMFFFASEKHPLRAACSTQDLIRGSSGKFPEREVLKS